MLQKGLLAKSFLLFMTPCKPAWLSPKPHFEKHQKIRVCKYKYKEEEEIKI
jgi:hypothetical protein